MKNWKRYLMSLVVAVFMVFGAQAVMWAETGTTDGFNWIYEDGIMAVTSYEGTSANILIPSGIETSTGKKTVTKIQRSASGFSSVIKGVTIPGSVTAIDELAFCGCTNLESVSIPDSVTSIGEDAFSSCTSLKSIVLPDSISSIEASTFESCTNLTTVTLPDSITSIGWHAFYGCNLKRITIPKAVTLIDEQAFGYYPNADDQPTKISGFQIYGYYGTIAESYADENGFSFTGKPGNLSEVASIELYDDEGDTIEGEMTYTGGEIEPNVALEGVLGYLEEGTDYTVSYSNNINVGTAAATVTGINHYYGTMKETFQIIPAKLSVKITLSGDQFTYTGDAIKPAVTVTRSSDGKTLKEGSDYKVAYSNNTKIGTATVTVTGIHNYTGTSSTTFRITGEEAEEKAEEKAASEKITIKKKPTSVKAKAKKRKVTISWKKIKKNKAGKKLLKKIKKIEVQVSLDKSFRQIVVDKKIKKTKSKLKVKLQKKKTYYVRVRYVGKDGVSKWSKVKKVRTKK